MRMTRFHAPTLKETSKDVEVTSHKFLLRGGYMRQVSAGIYDLLPLGWRVVRRLQEIIRDEMDRAGALEVLMPAVQPAELWQESGRWEHYGSELLRFEDRKGGKFCLGPTHEEVVVDLVRRDVRSHRQLPLNIYQIQTKFRDELRPRAGLLRGREFIMKDAYSFDVSTEASKQTYQAMFDAYTRIFTRCGLDFRPVEADTGSIGGSLSHEFQVLAASGEDAIVSCKSCGYTANVEKAITARAAALEPVEAKDLATVHTPDARSIEAVAELLDLPTSRVIKALVFEADDAPVVVLCRGDFEINEIAVKLALDATTIRLASDSTVERICGTPPGFAGPIGLREKARVIADHSIEGLTGAVIGANERDHHLQNVDVARDLDVDGWFELRLANHGDPCGRCGEPFASFRGIEVGQVFHLGTQYSTAMKASFLDEQSQEQALVMGCYGIGVTRTMAAAIEQNHDERGPIWPLALAPFAVQILPLQMNQPDVVAAAESIYELLQEQGVSVLLDDRDLRAGGKFADADLYGIPIRIQVGSRGLQGGLVEVRLRSRAEVDEIPVAEVAAWVHGQLEALR